jgi:hypothetical protein
VLTQVRVGEWLTASTVQQAKERIAALLRAHNGVAFCTECLSTVLGLASDTTTTATTALAQSWEFAKDYGSCSRCCNSAAVFRAQPRRYDP